MAAKRQQTNTEYHHPDDDRAREKKWLPLRKGVSDLHRRCQIGNKCNERYADALATAQVDEKLKEVVFLPATS